MSTPVRVRIAPSPTGTLHLGTARTALYNYLFARRHSGAFVLRLEDTDEVRSKEEHTEDIIAGLKWLGIHWDEGPDIGGPFPPYRQTQKIDHYENIANSLIAKGAAYLAYETPEELEALRETQKSNNQAHRYDNSGRHLSDHDLKRYEDEGRIPMIRFKIEEPRVVSWHDAIKGEISVDTADLGGDMVIVKSNGTATYNFAVVVDDIDMKMTHVIRGEDHIHNTAKQILLYEALGHEHPVFAHAALIQDTEHRKLSKRLHGESVHIDNYRQLGYMPEALVNYLAQMSWTPQIENGEAKEIFTLEEASKLFDLDRVSKSAAVFDIHRLNWFNGHYIRSLPIETVTERAVPFLQKHFNTGEYSQQELERLVDSVRSGLSVLNEIYDAARFYFGETCAIPDALRTENLCTENAKKILSKVLAELKDVPFSDGPACKKFVDKVGKELSIKGKELYWPLRVALSGSTHGPDLGAMIAILGEKRVKARLESALNLCSQV
ncbi:MAG: glutamate--tRNA ligase [Cyanobacteria bacterium SZAS LIN-5]|nr:glutamate--tRNA ligase [Cyanobacteria bacterium SZAS LIN-5]